MDFKLNLIKDRVPTLKKRKWLFLGMIIYLFICQVAIFYLCYHVTSNLIAMHNHKKKLGLSDKSRYAYVPKGKDPHKYIIETETTVSKYIDGLDKIYGVLSNRKDAASILLRFSAGLPSSAYIDNFVLDRASNRLRFHVIIPDEEARQSFNASKLISSWKADRALMSNVENIESSVSHRERKGKDRVLVSEFSCKLSD